MKLKFESCHLLYNAVPPENRELYRDLAINVYTHWRIHPEHLDELWKLQDKSCAYFTQ